MWLSDFRKFAEQFGDIIGWDATNRKYMLAHRRTGGTGNIINTRFQDVYDTYMRYWRDVELRA